MIKALFFDFDGVICDTEPTYFKYKLKKMEDMGFPVTKEFLLARIGESFRVMFPREFKVDNPEKYIQEYYNDTGKKDIDYLPLFNTEIIDLLNYCKQSNLSCYITSNSNHEQLETTLRKLNILHYFKKIYSNELLKVAKPNPLFYSLIVDDLKLNKDEIIVIEDSYHGISAAKDAGLFTIAKKESFFNIDQSKADIKIDLLTEVIDIIKKRNTN